jgi:hypothetical protein
MHHGGVLFYRAWFDGATIFPNYYSGIPLSHGFHLQPTAQDHGKFRFFLELGKMAKAESGAGWARRAASGQDRANRIRTIMLNLDRI